MTVLELQKSCKIKLNIQDSRLNTILEYQYRKSRYTEYIKRKVERTPLIAVIYLN